MSFDCSPNKTIILIFPLPSITWGIEGKHLVPYPRFMKRFSGCAFQCQSQISQSWLVSRLLRETCKKVWSTSAHKMACLERVKGRLSVSCHCSQHLHQSWEVMSHTCNAHANCKHFTNIELESPTQNHAQMPHTEFLCCQIC